MPFIGGGGSGGLPTDPVFNSVTSEVFNSETYAIVRTKDGFVLQDENGDFAYWDRNQGLQLLGQGDVYPNISDEKGLLTGGALVNGAPDDFVDIPTE